MKRMLYFIIFIIILSGIWAFFIEPYLVGVERIEIKLEELKGLKIVHLSDLHSFSFEKREKKVLRTLEELNFDLLLITGDFVDRTTKDLDSCSQFWKELVKRNEGKVFGVLGNHEYWHPQSEYIQELLEQSGIKILDNEFQKIKTNNGYFNLVGVGDPHTEHDNVKKAMPDNNKAKILLAHSPEIFRKVKEKDIALVLAGHTHGGQIDIPFLVNLILPLKHDKKYKEGLFKENNTYLYVNRGIGTTVLPIRFNAIPEITLITFR